MDFDRIHIKHRSELQTFHPENLSRNLIIELESSNAKILRNQLSISPTQNIFIWITVVGMIGWILWEIIRELGRVKISTEVIFSFTPNKCHSCQFYARNLYLQCAVHPSIVLTQQANNCRDYCNKHRQE